MKLLERIDPEICHDYLWIFDLDDTLIKTKSGKKFPVDETDYRWIRKPMLGEGVDIMIYTNQGGIKNEQQLETFMKKATHLFDAVCEWNPQANVSLIVADGKNTEYRKPSSIGFSKIIGSKVYKKMIMVGDAAGREKDHSDSDFKFAINIGAYFLVPEVYDVFVKQAIRHDDIDAIKKFVHWAEKNNEQQMSTEYSYVDLRAYVSDKPFTFDLLDDHVYLLCGRQGAGKSSFAKYCKRKGAHMIGYTTQQKAMNDVKRYVRYSSKPLVVDGTFSSKETRKKFIDVIKNSSYTPVIVYFNTPAEICKHNRLYREYVLGEQHIPEIAIRKYESSFDRPSSSDEGVDVIRIKFEINPETPDEYFLYYY